MAYARHQSFYLRDKWFSKGLRAIYKESTFFFDEYAFEKIGLGKNMVESLRFWLTALQVMGERVEEGVKENFFTTLGEIFYSKDILLQKSDTLSILHYNLVQNVDDQSTVYEWFFNIYNETSVSKSELLDSFISWVEKREPKKISERSLKRDIDCLIQFYTKKPDEYDPEDVLFCPFSRIGLMSYERTGEGFDVIKKISPDIKQIGITSLYYVLLEYCSDKGEDLISVDEIINEKNLWGKVFNLNRSKAIEALDILTNHQRYPLQYVRTNNLDYVKIPQVSPEIFLWEEL